jgi:hypothetical protein
MQDLVKQLQEADVDAELINADSPGGIGMAETFDILGRPAVVLVRDDETLVRVWQGTDDLPPVSEISYLAHQ